NNFMRLLGPPPNGPLRLDAVAGAVLFRAAQCSSCHVPSFTTGTVADVPELSNKTFFPFSDFLLHDMRSLGDWIVQGQATGREVRTAPLWGVRITGPFLQDGRAATISDAILAHDGEGRLSSLIFRLLPAAQRRQLLAFVNFL